MAATKKPKLVVTPTKDMPPVDDTNKRLELESHSRAPSGRIVAKRSYQAAGPMNVMLYHQELVVLDTENSEARVLIKRVDGSRPDISSDGKRALFHDTGPDGGLREVDLESGRVTRLTRPDGFAIRQPIYVETDRIMCVTTTKTQVLLQRTSNELEVVGQVELLDHCFTCWPILGGRFALIEQSSQAFLVAAKGTSLTSIKKTATSKEPMSLREGRLFIKDAKVGWAEATNLEEVWASL